MSDRELTCQQLVELVTDYFEDALPRSDRERFEAHLDECPWCVAHLAQMRTTIRLVRAGEALEQRPEVAGLLRAFRDFKRSAP
ncbi:MAG: anti-sigma factor family protein [Solirubrobacteraceae bacterium]